MNTELIEGREFISLADIGQYEEEAIEGYHGERDANAGRSPLPHDIYQMRVQYVGWTVSDGNGGNIDIAPGTWEKRLAPSNGSLYYMTHIKIVSDGNKDGAHDGYERTENLMTLVNKSGTTGAQALLQGLGVDTLMLGSHQAQIRACNEKLAGDGCLIGEEVDWESRLFDKEAVQKDKNGQPIPDGQGGYKKGVEVWRLRGMKNFPKNDDGSYRHEISLGDGYKLKSGDSLPSSLMPARAFLYHRRWVPQASLQHVEKQDNVEQQLQQSVDNVKAGLPANTTAAPAPRPPAPPPAAAAPPQAPQRPQPPAAPRRVTQPAR